MSFPKVSLVVTCYNKEPYLDDFFASVKAQKYDNIELIIVNDGSIDRSDVIIGKWIDVFRQCGFSVKSIEQKNQGVAAAIKNALPLISGEFVCFLDGDDYLMPEYVSELSRPLIERADIDFTVCHLGIRESRQGKVTTPYLLGTIDSKWFEKWLLKIINTSLYIYVYRASWLVYCELDKFLDYEYAVSHEPQIAISLFSKKPKGYLVDKMLYVYNIYAGALEKGHQGKSDGREVITEFQNKILTLHLNAIKRLDLERMAADKCVLMSKLGNMYTLAVKLYNNGFVDEANELILGVADLFIEYSNISIKLHDEPSAVYEVLYVAISRYLTDASVLKIERPSGGKIIAHGVLGHGARRILPLLYQTALEPDIFWDTNAGECNHDFFEKNVTTPDYNMINPGDMVFIFPTELGIRRDIVNSYLEYNVRLYVFENIIENLAAIKFPEICL